MANNNDLTVNIKATFDKSNMGEFQTEVTKAVEDAAKSVKAIEIKANTQSARNSLQKFTSYLTSLSNAKDGYTTLKIHANINDAKKQVNELKTVLSSFGKENKVVIDAKADKVYDRLNGIVKLMRQMQFTGNRAIKIEANAQKAIDTLKILKKEYGDVAKQIKITASISGATEVINNLKAIQSLLKKIQKDSNINVKAKIDTSSVQRQVEKATAQTKVQTDNIGTDETKINRQRQKAIEEDARITRQLEKEREAVLQFEQRVRYALGKKGLSGGLSVVDKEDINNVQKIQQTLVSATSTMAQLRAEALRAGNALNRAVNPQEIEKANAAFNRAITNLVNYQRATRGLTKNSEGFLIEKLAVGNIKAGTRAYEVLIQRIKEAVQAQKDLNVQTGRRPPREFDNTFLGYLQNINMGRALSGMAYAARGELNTVQAFGSLISSLSSVSGVVGSFAKFLGGLGVAVLAFTGVVNAAATAFNSLINVLSQVGRAIYDALKPGIELYKLRETAELSLAATLSNMATEEGRNISYERGLELSAGLVNRAFMDALKSAFNPEELIRAMQGTLGIAFARGLNLDQAYNVVKSTAAVAKSIQLQPNQLLQEVRDILQGTLTAKSSQVAYAVGMNPESLREAQSVGTKIGLTDEGIQQAQEQGRLYEYIMEKMQTYNIALEKYADTFSGAMDRLTESWALAGMKIFEKIAPGLNGLIDNIINDFILTIDENNMPQLSDNLKQVGEALSDIIAHLMSVIDAVIAFVKDLTGQEDTIGAIKALIIDMIDIAAFGFLYVLQCAEWLKESAIGLYNIVQRISNLSGVLDAGVVFIEEFTAALIKLITLDFKGFIDKVESAQDRAAKNIQERWNEGIIDSTNISGRHGLGLFEQYRGKNRLAYEEGKLRYRDRTPKPYDATKIEAKAMADAAKQSYAEQKRMIQAALEDVKSALKEYIAKLQDLQEKNSLSYQQGFKSMDDYFTAKAQLDLQEAQARLEAIDKEIALVGSLNPPDESARYQQQRDLIKLGSQRNEELRKLGKAQEAQLDILKQLNARRDIMAQGSYVGTSKQGIKDALEYTTYTYNELQGSALINSQMELMSVGCVEAVEKAMSAFTTMGEEAYDRGIRGVDSLLDYFREKGVEIIPYDRSKLAEGDVAFMGHGEDDLWHVVMYHLGQWLGNHGMGEEAITNLHDLDWYEGYYDNVFIAKVSEAGDTFKEQIRSALGAVAELPEATTKGGKEVRDASIKALEEQWQAQKILTDNLYNFDEALEASAVILENDFNKKLRRASVTLDDEKLADIYRKQNVFDRIKMVSDQASKYLDSTLKEMQRTGLARNLNFQYITMLGQDMVTHYFENAFNAVSDKFSPAASLEKLLQAATEAEQKGFTFQAQAIRDKIDSFVTNFVGIINQWISRASEYFDMQRNIIDANSGLTEFVKEERKSQLSKGQARWNAKVYEAEVQNLERQIELLQQREDIDERTKNGQLTNLQIERERAVLLQRQNELLGENKTLWQETMDAANKALEDGLYKFMTDYVNTAESVGEAFRNLAIDILSDLQKFFAKKAITDLMHVITGEPNVTYSAPDAASIATSQNTATIVSQLTTANGLLSQIAGTDTTSLVEQQVDNTIDQAHDAQDSVTQQQQLVNQQQINMTEQRREHEDKRHNMQTESGVGGSSSVGVEGGAVSPFTTGITKGAGNTGLTNHNFIANFMNHPMFGGILDFANSIFGSALGQLAGIGFAIDSFINGDRKEQLLATIYIELQLIYQTLVSILTNIATMGTMFYNSGFGYSTGGYISGPGTSTSDSIHAMLSNGEYVIKADAVRRYGLNFLDAVNSGHFTRMRTVIPRFADGGYVGDALQDTARGMTDFAKNIGTSVSTTNNMNVALVRNEQEAYEHFMRSPAGQRILVDFQKGNGRVFARFNR